MMAGAPNASSNLPDSSGRSFATSLSSQSTTVPAFHHSGAMIGLHNIQGNINVLSMPSSLASRNSPMGGAPSSGVQQPGGSISSGRIASNNLPASSQIFHSSTYGYSGVTNRGIGLVGSPPFSSSMNGVGSPMLGINPSSAVISSRILGLGASPLLGDSTSRLTNSFGNIAEGGNIGRSMSISSGGLSVPGLASRVNLTSIGGPGSLSVQGANRLRSGMLQQAPQMIGMLGNSYPASGGSISQSQVQGGNNALSSMGMLNDVNANDKSPFDTNDFPQLTGRPSSSGGAQGQSVPLRKQGIGVNSIVQQSQEFSIQNEDFPALPGFKGGSSDFAMDLHQKEQLHDSVSMMQPQQLSGSPGFHMARSVGFNLGGSYTPHHQQKEQHAPSFNVVDFSPANNQDLHLNSSDPFLSPHRNYHPQVQTSGPPGIGLRSINSPNPSTGSGVYNQLVQQYQHPQNQSQFYLQQMSTVNQSYRDQNMKLMQGTQGRHESHDRFGLLGLLSVIKLNDPELSLLALGLDLKTLGLNLNSAGTLYETFGCPWSEEPAKGEPEYCVPSCYYAKPPSDLHQGYFCKFKIETLFYIFYSMPKDDAQLYAAHELCSRGWFYHREHRLWFIGVPNMEPLVKTNTYERGSYHCFDPNAWDTVRKDNFVVYYEMVEKMLPTPSPSNPQN